MDDEAGSDAAMSGGPTTDTTGGVSRRRLLIAAGGVAGAAWVSPAMTSIAAACTGSCLTPSVLDWATYYTPGQTPTSTVVGGVTVTQTFTSTGSAPGANSNRINGGTSGTFSPYLRLEWTSPLAAANSSQQIVFSFSQTVYDPCFVITDVDASTGGWQDIITVSATGPGPAPTIGASFTGPFVAGTNPWNGILTSGDAPSNTTNGNIDVEISGAVDTFTVLYNQANFNATQTQHIGIVNPTWCE